MTKTLPLTPKTLNRLLLLLVCILALGLGYYHYRWELAQRQLHRLQLRYTQLQETSDIQVK